MSSVTSKTVVGVFGSADQARNAIAALREAGFPQTSISFIMRSGEDKTIAHESSVVKDAEIGAAVGGVGGVLIGLAAVAIPGVGPVVVLGPALAALGGAGLGAVAGGLVGALTQAGVSREKAESYAESVRRGDAIVTVQAEEHRAEMALRIMDGHGAIDIEAPRASENEQLSGQHPGVEPLSEDELRREREFYAGPGQKVSEWTPETRRERELSGDEPGTLWPHKEAYDIGEDLVESAPTDERSK